ncbi:MULTISPECIES: hypothetical protein [unclassified Streptomyces]
MDILRNQYPEEYKALLAELGARQPRCIPTAPRALLGEASGAVL